ncbi:MAG: cyclic nucleotide-binding domain-containing protein [Deltaproteobacteria bacterium]|jgi:CRP/FNR family transcriptional regulator, cyclic AMP receptor protein|nr:cyclic nucleotide-binding domain-containing protein [Deltaproteobacteria bacterium]MBT4269386.1 cyclic nucleotide-binding domain-containing protein [Deltaproteobacteria bacterium]MBT4638677.1 cyclic nucleotide-binding domain-containing protein [Deltaproteobacteria bacterium]MBT6501896.1 cyclic nucleotide-binding domain-containing protein [Deltaproteobacteria bacterium]MBT6616138.1 cyclic nucleotide-binding domain-containing protein [Deltaproteobacteria bacterium]
MNFKELELFKGVDFTMIKEISEICSEKHYDKDEVLFHAGDKADRLFFLEYGAVNLVVNSNTGVNFGISEPGEVFGWSAMVEAGAYTATGVAITDLNVFEAEREKLNLIFNRHPKDGLRVMKSLAGVISKRLNVAYQDLVSCREK